MKKFLKNFEKKFKKFWKNFEKKLKKFWKKIKKILKKFWKKIKIFEKFQLLNSLPKHTQDYTSTPRFQSLRSLSPFSTLRFPFIKIISGVAPFVLYVKHLRSILKA